MPSAESLKVLLVLLPGFVTTGVIRSLYVGQNESEFDKVVRALAYSFLNYAIYAGFKSLLNFTGFFDLSRPLPSSTADVVLLAAISLILGLGVAAYKNNDGHRLWRRCRVTHRSSRQDIWQDSFVEGQKSYVLVTLEDGRRLVGWPLRFGDDMEKPSLFLTDGYWIGENDVHIPFGNEGILLLATMKIASVEFL